MKKTIFLSLLFFIVSFCKIFGQTKDVNAVYTDYFTNTRELPHLHLNKTSFLKGEEIWFQAYVLEQNSGKPHPTTSNLYVSIFDNDGKLKDQHLVYIKNGIGRGNILIDSTFNKNNYYLKASTNWMKNFKEDNSYSQKIQIISSEKVTNTTSKNEEDFFEFKLFPEGGHILANTVNRIGILLKDSKNKGIKIVKGEIKNMDGDVIGEFSNNEQGLGAKNTYIIDNEIFNFEATLANGAIIKATTSLPKKIGITLNTKNLEDSFSLNILTNTNSLEQLALKKYRILINNTKGFKNIYFTFNEDDETYEFNLKKKSLYKGVNIITVFNENDIPVLERLIYNEFEEISETELAITKVKSTKDSTIVKISNAYNEKFFLSSSFLPSSTKAYKPQHNIKSSILLKPYLKGFIEKPQKYFDKKNKLRLKHLDVLLLTQGWSKYNWNDIFNKPPTNIFEFENGIDITFSLNKNLGKKEKILIYSNENNLVGEILPNQNPYNINNSFIYKDSEIQFSLVNGNQYLEARPILSFSNSNIVETINLDNLVNGDQVFKLKEVLNSDFTNLINGTETLNEIVIVANKKYDNETKGIATTFKKLEFKNMAFSQDKLSDFLWELTKQYRFTKQPLRIFHLNNLNITDNPMQLSSIEMEDVREIRIGTSIFGLKREIHIFTYSLREFDKIQVKSTKVKLPVGFIKDKEYYQPKYTSITKQTYDKYGAIYWKSNLEIEPNSSIVVNFPKKYQDQIRVFIEGISESGKLIAKEAVVALD